MLYQLIFWLLSETHKQPSTPKAAIVIEDSSDVTMHDNVSVGAPLVSAKNTKNLDLRRNVTILPSPANVPFTTKVMIDITAALVASLVIYLAQIILWQIFHIKLPGVS